MKRKKVSVGIRLSEQSLRMADELGRRFGLSRASVVELAVHKLCRSDLGDERTDRIIEEETEGDAGA